MKLVIASDHAGFALKGELLEVLRERGVDLEDLGAFNGESVDYPDFATQVARRIAGGGAQFGVLICGSGIGMSIVANKYRGIRAAVCRTEYEAHVSRAHNDANVLCLGERVTGPGLARTIIEEFLDTPFEGGRHTRRVQKIHDAEKQQ